jgi:signal transduction histidine kinase
MYNALAGDRIRKLLPFRGEMQKQVWKRLLARPVWLLSGGVAILLLLGFGLLFYSSWRHDVQLQPIQQHLQFIAAIEAADEQLRGLSVRYAGSDSGILPVAVVDGVQQLIAELQTNDKHLHPDSPSQLDFASRQLRAFDGTAAYPLDEASQALRDTLAAELTAHSVLMSEVRSMAQRELRITLGILVGLLLFTIPLSVIVRRRIIMPLDDLGYLMALLSRHGYTSASLQGVDPMLRPLFVNYNRMVSRLVDLEQTHQKREETLTDSVRRATRLLLQQHRRLAQAERLGAVGEITASVAHELRNPLTSMHMALQNLSSDLEDPDHVERVDMVITEIKRLSQQLNLLLDSARQVPETTASTDVSLVLHDLLTLVRYQLHEQINLDLDVPDTCLCQLPEAQFRQCMLNLIVNAGQMLDDNPGHILVRVRMGDDNIMQLIVEDDGPGFPEQILLSGARVFGSLRAGGTGLGLVIVRRFVSDMGGRMRLENRSPHGARVVLNIPCGA